ncbi:unnamed protein product [Eretmochelys imbricata]
MKVCPEGRCCPRVLPAFIQSSSRAPSLRLRGRCQIFKKVSRTDPSNYRLVSLTSVPDKLVETIVKSRIIRHTDEHDLLGKSQHGFCKGKSSLTNLLEFFEEVNKHVDEGDPVDIVYLAFEKAFDNVPHQRLLSKVSSHGIRGKVLSWISSWVKDRRQRVEINGQFSEWREVNSGVPQGSILGSVLFSIFINDLEKGVNTEVAKFADDTKLLKIVKSKANYEGLQKDLTKLGDWATKWQMKFSVDKCKVMHTGKHNPNYTYTMTGSKLAVTTQERSWSHCGEFSENIHSLCSRSQKTNRKLGIIKKGIDSKTENILLPLYKSMVRPHLEYCVQM